MTLGLENYSIKVLVGIVGIVLATFQLSRIKAMSVAVGGVVTKDDCTPIDKMYILLFKKTK